MHVKEKTLEAWFAPFRENIVGIENTLETPFGKKPLVYADWIASGRLYQPIEDKLSKEIGPMVGNTHSETTETGRAMTYAYHEAHQIIKKHVNACSEDVIITAGSGMTGVLAKFQRILGLRVPERIPFPDIPENERPVVFITHMEHHSNQTPWLESICDVVVIPPDEHLLVQPDALHRAIQPYKHRKTIIGSFSACSNVTGVIPPYHELTAIIHEFGGVAIVDFAASAPYVSIDMHPENPAQALDAIAFSPHKFLGGPGSSGVLIFNKKLYRNRIPDHPGGGTVAWTNPWGGHAYFDDIEIREDGGTPGFMQAIRAALSVKLKEAMGIENIRNREEELVDAAFERLGKIPDLFVLAADARERLGVFSFYVKNVHHNLIVRLLNDRYGIQVRGGCSCAGTYGHYLLHVDEETSRKITQLIDDGDLSLKPGWVRLSLHPTMTDAELEYILSAIEQTVAHAKEWGEKYEYCPKANEFRYKGFEEKTKEEVKAWFDL